MKCNTIDGLFLDYFSTKYSIRKILKIVGNNNFKWVYFGENIPHGVVDGMLKYPFVNSALDFIGVVL